MCYLIVEEIEKSYSKKKVLDKVSLQIEKGSFMSILGESGCGKTTLLRTIAGLAMQDSGRLILDEKDISHIPTQKRNVSMVFQDYILFPHLNVMGNVEFGLKMKGVEEKKRRNAALEYLDLVQLIGMENRYPHELSGGQKQRVAIARALVTEPKVVLLDEPFSSLDTNLRDEMCGFIKELQQKMHMTTIMVTHDRKEAMQLSDKILILHNGKSVQCGTPEEVYKRPVNLFVARFMGDLNLLEGYRKNNRFYSRIGLEFEDDGTDQNLTYAVRPESIAMCKEDNGSCVRGEIQKKIYLGEKVVYTVMVNSADLSVLTLNEMGYETGQSVFLNIPPGAVMKKVRI